jgi:F0F1-type ATP synthase membrane subunit b/b'
MELAHTIEQLFIDAIPTAILVFLFYLFLRAEFFRPLEQVLAKRKARTEGALREAGATQAAAQEKLRTYHEALRKIRAEIQAEQETIRRAALDERAEGLRTARARGNERVRAAKDRMVAEMAATRVQLDEQSRGLAEEIVRVILERPPAGAPMAKEF